MSFLPKLTEEEAFKACQTLVFMPGIGYCPVTYWVEEKIQKNSQPVGRSFFNMDFFKKFGSICMGIILGVLFINLRLA